MKRRPARPQLSLALVVCFGLMIGVAIVSSTFPSHAQQDLVGEAVPPIVAEAIARAGLLRPTNVRQRGPNYTANATTRAGAPVKVVIQGTTGAIIGYRVIVPEGAGILSGR